MGNFLNDLEVVKVYLITRSPEVIWLKMDKCEYIKNKLILKKQYGKIKWNYKWSIEKQYLLVYSIISLIHEGFLEVYEQKIHNPREK